MSDILFGKASEPPSPTIADLEAAGFTVLALTQDAASELANWIEWQVGKGLYVPSVGPDLLQAIGTQAFDNTVQDLQASKAPVRYGGEGGA
jgi:hypothetical protein